MGNAVAPEDEKDPTNLSNEPSFDSNSATSENLVSDSDEFKPTVMIKRQSKDYAATSVENGNENDGQKKVHENSDKQTTPNESTEDQQQMKDEIQPNRISGQFEATTP